MGPLQLDNGFRGERLTRAKDPESPGIKYSDKKPGFIKSIFIKTMEVQMGEHGTTLYVKKSDANKFIKAHIGELSDEKKKRSYSSKEIRRILPKLFSPAEE